MTDDEKDWHGCAVALSKRAWEAAVEGDIKSGRAWRRRALAASLHHAGEGWFTIRQRLVPDLTDADMLYLARWTS